MVYLEIILKEMLDNLYPWHFHLGGAIIIIALLLFFWFIFRGVHKFTKSVSTVLEHNEKMQKLWEQLDETRKESNKNKTISDFVSRVIYNIKPYIDTLNEIRVLLNPSQRINDSLALLRRLLDGLTSDIKYKSGEHHRCCIWIIEDQVLRPAIYSAGFPNNYKEVRHLDRDRSIAGRAFRTNQTQNIDDVTKDTEWVRNDNSRSKYKSLIAIPIGSMGVLTIDGINPMGVECQYIGELFSSVIDGAIREYHIALTDYHYETEIDPDLDSDVEIEEDIG